MIRFQYLVFSVFISLSLSAQITIDTTYFDMNWEEIEASDSNGFYRIIQMDTNTVQFLVYDYFMSGALQMEGTYRSISPDKKMGNFTWFYESGQKQMHVFYKDDQQQGELSEWYENGKLKSYRFYKDGKLDGLSEYYSPDGYLEKAVEYRAGLKHGKFSSFYTNGQEIRKDTYKNDDFISGKCFTHTGSDTSWFEYLSPPKFKSGGLEKFRAYVQSHIIYPGQAKAEKQEGSVYVQFNIAKSGKVIKAKIIRKDKEYFNREALKVIQSSPDWQPAKCDGSIVEITLIVPIFFLPPAE